ncbi:MAG: hypothetical protein ACRC78_25790, partial [Planktothrix sp.]
MPITQQDIVTLQTELKQLGFSGTNGFSFQDLVLVAYIKGINGGGGGGGGGGDASAANQILQLAQETLIAINAELGLDQLQLIAINTDRIPEQISSRLPVILSDAQIVELQSVKAFLSNANGTTSATSNTWTQVLEASGVRNGFFFQNISDAILEVGLGAEGLEFPVAQIPPS